MSEVVRIDARRGEGLDVAGRWLLLVVLCLLSLGLVMVYSVSAPPRLREQGTDAAWVPLLVQGGKVAFGLVFLWLGMRVRLEWLLKHDRWIAGAVLLMLALVWIPAIGTKINGARRWFDLGVCNVQPAELAKIALILFVAGTSARLGGRVRSFRHGLLPLMLALGLAAGLLLLQPDFGSALFLMGLGAFLFVFAGAPVRQFGIVGLVALPACIAYAWTSLGHVQRRVDEFLNPEVGGQAWQSLVALGSGGAFGNGLGAGMAKLGFLPMISSDFILAAVGEELGFMGTSLVVLLFVLFLMMGSRIVLAQQSHPGFLVGVGVTLMITVQALINIAVVTGAVPTKGIALPFLSAGGSALATSLFGVGLLLNLSMRRGAPLALESDPADEAAPAEPWPGGVFRRFRPVPRPAIATGAHGEATTPEAKTTHG
jgi:cell division protein FtsW